MSRLTSESAIRSLRSCAYFEKVSIKGEGAEHSVLLEERKFYIMKSKERLCIPRDVAVEVIAISERIGDIRIHYAGFAHPGFGLHVPKADVAHL